MGGNSNGKGLSAVGSGLRAPGVAILLLGAMATASLAHAETLLRAVLGQHVAVQRIEVGRLDVEIVASPSASSGPFRASRLIVPLARLVDPELTPEIALDDVTIRRVGDPGGWDGEATLREVRISDGPTAGERSIVIEGALDASPLQVAASFAPAEPAADGRRQSLPGVEETIEGVLDADGQALEARIRLDVTALGDLLETLRLRRQLEGRGQLRLRLAGPVDALAANDISLEVELATGEQLRVDGRIADFSSLAGIELGFTANLAETAEAAAQASGLDLQALRGEVQGSVTALTVEGLVLSTNLTSADIREIGPIRVERLTRDGEGRLVLSGVRILAGDPAAPSLDLRGRIDDLLGRSGIAFSGNFDLDLIDLATGMSAPPELGRLVGTLALSDASGQLQLERLEARQSGDGPLELRLEKPPAAPGEPSSPISLDLTIRDLDALAAARDAPPIGGGSAAFAGTIAFGDEVEIFGRGHVGSSPVWLDLAQDVVEDQLQLRGGIKSPRLQLADLPRMVDLVRLWPRAEADEVGGTGEQLRSRLDAELAVEASIVDGDDYRQGAFTGTLTVRDERVLVRPLRLDYLGGRASAEFSFDMGEAPPPARLEARIDALDTGRLLTELGVRPLVVGDLDAVLDLEATGPGLAALKNSLAGEIEVLMGEGRIGSRLLELTAQDIVSWLFSAGSATRLVCAAGRLRFTAGRGVVEGLILKTDNIQLVGAGEIDLGQERLDLAFEPQPMRGRLLPAVTSFRVQGPLTAPEVNLNTAGGVAGRAVVETLTLPFNVLGALLGSITAGSDATCTLEP
jgi:AsmA family protein